MSDTLDVLRSLGLGYPYQRMIAGAALAGGVCYALQLPKASFKQKDGSIRPWKLIDGDEDATWLPFFSIPLAGAIAFGVFI